jgi:hypothetical protein
MQEKPSANAVKSDNQSSSLADTHGKIADVEVRNLLGTLRLNLTQPECSDGSQNG